MAWLITATARALAAGDPPGALKRVAPRNDAPEKVARLQLGKLGAMLDEQATYIGVPKQGPYRAEHYRY